VALSALRFAPFGIAGLLAAAVPNGSTATQVKPAASQESLAAIAASQSALRGKVVLLDFWAESCGPCKDAMPKMQALHERYGPTGLVVIGIDFPDGDPAEAERATSYVAQEGYSYMVMLEGDSVAQAYRVETLPTLYVIDRNGTIRYRKVGTREGTGTPEECRRAFEKSLDTAIEEILR